MKRTLIVAVMAAMLLVGSGCSPDETATTDETAQENEPAAKNTEVCRECETRMRYIMIGLHGFHDTFGAFPAAYTVDANGKPLHSWRTLILPFIEATGLYAQVALDEPWDSETNRKLWDRMPDFYRCPACDAAIEAGEVPIPEGGNVGNLTPYCLIVGPDAMGRPGDKAGARTGGITIAKTMDGTSNTLGGVERKTPVIWMSPIDIPQAELDNGVGRSDTGIGSAHPSDACAARMDATIFRIPDTTAPEKLKAWSTIAGGESVPMKP